MQPLPAERFVHADWLRARVNIDYHVEVERATLRRYVERRGWTAVEYVDEGVSGSKDRRPALDELIKAGRRRRFDVLVCWRLDRLRRNLRHLILLLDELQALGIGFVTLGEGIDTSTAAGRLQLHILSAIAEFERSRIQERVRAGLARARAQGGRLGRPRLHPLVSPGPRRSSSSPGTILSLFSSR